MSSLLFLDVETTGITEEDRLCQVAFRHNDTDRNELFKPRLPIKLTAMAVTHITEKHVADKPAFKGSKLCTELADLSSAGAILVAHNAKFDMEMLAKEGVTFPRYICTLKIAKHIDPGGRFENHQLQYLRYYYGVEVEAVAHDAFGDIVVLEAVFAHLYKDFVDKEFPEGKTEGMLQGVLNRMVEVSQQPTLLTHIRFGKYRDKPEKEQLISSIAKADRNYLAWLLEQKMMKPEGEEDWLYTLKHYLKTPA